MTEREAQGGGQAIPKWLLYGLVAKAVIVIVITGAVLWYAGIFG